MEPPINNDADVYEYLILNPEDGEEVEEEEKPFSYFKLLDKPRILPEPVDLTHEHLKEITYELGLIKLCWPEVLEPYFEDRTNFPARYLKNNEKEKVLLLYAENFRKQFIQKYPERKPLLLAVENECGILKMVCTTLRPTNVPYPELETWEGCAKFLADHIKFEPFEDIPTLIPNRLYSPHTTLLRQSGQSFEMATVLCSILIGVGYNAYVVSGYAIKDVTLRIMNRTDCPIPPFKEEEEKPPEQPVEEKYKLKPPRDLRSKFLLMMEQRELDKIREKEEKIAEENNQKRLEEEARPLDELEGQRIHAWVVILPPNKDIQEPFYVEPNTGFAHPTDTDIYLGIESIWNHQNYYVNLQDCTKGLADMEYDLKNNEKWLHFLIAEPIKFRQQKVKELGDDEENRDMFEEKHLDMPTSWSMKINIPHEALKKRFPEGYKTTNFKRVIVEEYASFISYDGLVLRIIRYNDFDCTIPEVVEEEFENRHDKFYRSIYKCDTNLVTDYFHKGREDAVIKHVFIKNNDEVNAKRTIFFNHSGRYDALHKIEVEPNKITEHYKDRDDKLYFRQVTYDTGEDPHAKTGPSYRRPILKVIQKFERDESKFSHEDVASREFAIVDREIRIKFHYGKNNVTASTRIFMKPPISEIGGEEMVFDPELTYGYQAEIGVKRPSQLSLYLMFEEQLKEEEKVINNIREVEAQISEFLLIRAREMAFSKLDVPLFNIEQNAESRQAMLDREEQARAYKEKEIEEDIDYFAPYLAKLGGPARLTVKQAREARDCCLTEFKDLLVNRANVIQKHFEKMHDKLQAKKLYYTATHDMLTPAEEADYFVEVNDIMTVMKTLQMRLCRHKELASVRYQVMVNYLSHHPMLKILYQKRKKSK